MAWKVEFNHQAFRQLGRLDPQAQERIARYLRERIAGCDDPRQFGVVLTGDRAGRWRYRIGDYRVVCRLDDEQAIVRVIAIAHRREVYRRRR